MKIAIRIFFYISLLFLLIGCGQVKEENIDSGNYIVQIHTVSSEIKAFSQNSINAVIFRHNSITSHNGIQFTAFYDEFGNLILGKRTLNSKVWEMKNTHLTGDVLNAHNSISIAIDGDGYLHLSWGQHSVPLNYCKSVAPYSLELTEKIKMTNIKENKVTYPEFYNFSNGDLLFAYRDGESGNGNLMLNYYNKETKKWNKIGDSLIDGEGVRNAYWQIFIDEKDTIHVSWNWRENSDVASNHDLCYAKSNDKGLTWLKSNNEQYTLPLTLKNSEYIANIPKQNELINTTSMYVDNRDIGILSC